MYSWRAEYIAALAEKDPERQRKLVHQAIETIEKRRMSSLKIGREEWESMEQADKALKLLKRSLSEGRRRN